MPTPALILMDLVTWHAVRGSAIGWYVDRMNESPSGGIADSVTPLLAPIDGLVARRMLISEATAAIEAQYYIWEADASGLLLLDDVLRAADRGVQVRIIVDDLHLRSHHHGKAAVDSHPNISLRTYRPFSAGSGPLRQAVEFVAHFENLDHRMHNKLLVVDNERAVVGGRNLADGHFGLSDTCDLVDFDVVVEGEVVAQFVDIFDRYWESAAVAGVHHRAPRASSRQHIARDLARHGPVLEEAIARSATIEAELQSASFELPSGAVTVVADVPDFDGAVGPDQVIEALQGEVKDAEHRVIAFSPFFVPTENDIDWYTDLTHSGVQVKLLTNSLASNEGTISNSGLDRMRRSVVDAGFELHELKPDAAVKPEWEVPPTKAEYLGLHAKMYVIDGSVVLLGSVNLDPRSRHINTEMVIRIASPDLAQWCEQRMLELMTSENSWRIGVDDGGRVLWIDDTGATTKQPARGIAQRVANMIFGQLPIDSYV